VPAETCAGQLAQPETPALWQSVGLQETPTASHSPQKLRTSRPRKGALGDHRHRTSASVPSPCLDCAYSGLEYNLSLATLPPNPAETKSAALTSPSQFPISSQPVCWLQIRSWDKKPSPPPFLPLSGVPQVALVLWELRLTDTHPFPQSLKSVSGTVFLLPTQVCSSTSMLSTSPCP
jgi:hypothetical protein